MALDNPEFAASIQPLPTGDGVDIAGKAAQRLRDFDLPHIADDIEARIRMGEKKYGTRLKSHNGRDAFLDLYQEILDALNYSQQLVIEGRANEDFFNHLMDIAERLYPFLNRKA